MTTETTISNKSRATTHYNHWNLDLAYWLRYILIERGFFKEEDGSYAYQCNIEAFLNGFCFYYAKSKARDANSLTKEEVYALFKDVAELLQVALPSEFSRFQAAEKNLPIWAHFPNKLPYIFTPKDLPCPELPSS